MNIGIIGLLAAVTVPVIVFGLLSPHATPPEGDTGLTSHLAPVFVAGVFAVGIFTAAPRLRALLWHWMALIACAPVLLVIHQKGSWWTGPLLLRVPGPRRGTAGPARGVHVRERLRVPVPAPPLLAVAAGRPADRGTRRLSSRRSSGTPARTIGRRGRPPRWAEHPRTGKGYFLVNVAGIGTAR
jgi:hypothetical protein